MKKVMLKRLKKVVPAKVSREEIELEIESQLERKGLLHHDFNGEGNNQVSNVFSVTILCTIYFANIGRATKYTF